jgi:oligosaccharide reducing-end xylanase
MEGAYYNGQYLNRLERLGYSQAEIDNKLESTFEEMFYGPEGVRLCHCAGPDMMYIEDTGNHDVRTEGMSYAMMFCVQMNRQKEFDCLWRWVVTHMYLTEGENAGYFAWSCHTDGSKNSDGPAPDGEEFFASSTSAAP